MESTKKPSIFVCKQCKENNVEIERKPKTQRAHK